MSKKTRPTVYNVKKKKSESTHIISTVAMIAFAGVIGYVGFSLAKPTDDGKIDSSPDAQLALNTTVTTTTTPETTTNLIETQSSITQTYIVNANPDSTDTDNNDSQIIKTELTTDSITTSTEQKTTSLNESTTTQPSTTEAVKPKENKNSFSSIKYAVELPSSALSDSDTFVGILKDVKQKYPDAGAVAVPIKMEGGLLNYKSLTSMAAGTNLCTGSMTAEEIYNIAAQNGLAVYGTLSVLNDYQFPQINRDSAIWLADNTGEWLDFRPEEGGKPWMSPYSNTTLSYLTGICEELSDAGFTAVLCEDFYYPSFWDSDAEFLDYDKYIGSESYKGLVKLANDLANNLKGKIDMVLEIYAPNAMSGATVVYHPEELNVPNVLLDTDSDSSSDVLNWIENQKQTLPANYSLAFSDSNVSEQDTGNANYIVTYGG
ncbi:MAG: hypothetical protein IJZ64_05885 [Ruminococcus sp.]|nr:hypothetical protein [Ruminococcus sp.]